MGLQLTKRCFDGQGQMGLLTGTAYQPETCNSWQTQPIREVEQIGDKSCPSN